jgi:hypothetical protein
MIEDRRKDKEEKVVDDDINDDRRLDLIRNNAGTQTRFDPGLHELFLANHRVEAEA